MEYDLFGGTIYPLFEVFPPKWLLKDKVTFDMLYCTRVLPEGPIAADLVFGPNMAVRTSIFKTGFRFNENIGPNGTDPNYPMGSETEFCRRVERSGAKAWFAKEPCVEIIISKSQLSRSFWASRFYRHGRGVARQSWDFRQPPPQSLSRPFILDQAWRVYNMQQRISPLPSQRFKGLSAYHWRRGFCDEWATQSHTGTAENGKS